MTNTVPDEARICVACVGDGTDPATGRTCLRCKGTRIDPDPLAPAGPRPVRISRRHSAVMLAVIACAWALALLAMTGVFR